MAFVASIALRMCIFGKTNPSVIFIGFLFYKAWAIGDGKYSIANLSAGNPEEASRLII